jgi:hypothetical protein
MYGICLDTKLQKLRAILTGLSGSQAIPFCDHEVSFQPSDRTEYGPQRNDDIVLCLRSEVLEENAIIPMNKRKWKLIQRNQPEPPKPGLMLANHRIVNESFIDGNVLEFMELLGYSFSHEYLVKGYRYCIGKMYVDIQKVFKLTEQLNAASIHPLMENAHWMVHAYCPNSQQDQVKSISFQLSQLAKQLEALVLLEVVDHTNLQYSIKYE